MKSGRPAAQKQKPSLCCLELSLKRHLNIRTEAFGLSRKQEQKAELAGLVATSMVFLGAGEQVGTGTGAVHSFL